MASRKSKPKSERQKLGRGTKIPVKSGGYLIAGAGNGPKPGAPNAGRPKNEWKARLQAMVSQDAVLDEVERALLAGREDPFFKDALQYCTDHGYGRANQPVDLTATITIADALAQARERARQR